MPTESDFEPALERIEDVIVRLGGSIEARHQDTVEVDGEHIEFRTIYAIEDAYDRPYYVVGRRDLELFGLVYEFDLIGVLADVIETGGRERIV